MEIVITSNQFYDYQKEVLEKLEAQRTLFDRSRNLLVVATGLGKTVISAFDYKRFLTKNPRARLLGRTEKRF